LSYLHTLLPPVIHRDLKTANVLCALDEQDHIKLAKITDFDIARFINDSSNPLTVVGTPAYTAPEVYGFRNKGYSVQADIWSFGILLVEVVTMKPAFSNLKSFEIPEKVIGGALPEMPNPNTVDKELLPVFDLIRRCLVVDPAKRPNSTQIAQEMALIS